MENHESAKSPSARIPKSVCIAGAGISGLSLAYYLVKYLPLTGEDTLKIDIFESAAEIGGNCKTFQIDMGGSTRWADMGVNDFNRDTYKKLNELMKFAECTGQKLEDTEMYFTSGSELCYTEEGDGKNFTKMPDPILTGVNNFKKFAYTDATAKDSKFAKLSLSDYVEHVEKKDLYPRDFVYGNLYPRVNAMYFCNGNPGSLPFAGIMSYYALQEGLGNQNKDNPDRCYFSKGSQEWIKAFAAKLLDMPGKRITLKTGTGITVQSAGDSCVVLAGGERKTYDAVVLCMPANRAMDCINPLDTRYNYMREALSKFKYNDNDKAVVHTDAKILAKGMNTWRTYNINIYNSGETKLYTITYVGNRHQNDAANCAEHPANSPQFLITMNAPESLDTKAIIKQTNGESTDTKFPHQKLDMSTHDNQLDLMNIQNKDNSNVWFVNGYAVGAGLHEECINYAEFIAAKMLNIVSDKQIHFDFTPGAEQRAPDYLLHAHDPEK